MYNTEDQPHVSLFEMLAALFLVAAIASACLAAFLIWSIRGTPFFFTTLVTSAVAGIVSLVGRGASKKVQLLVLVIIGAVVWYGAHLAYQIAIGAF